MIKKYILTPEESARIEKIEQLTPEELKDYHEFLLSLPEATNQKEARANDAAIDAYLGVTQITLAKDESIRLEMYFAMTRQRIADELEIWQSLKDDPATPAAERNLIFWQNIKDLIDRINKELRGF